MDVVDALVIIILLMAFLYGVFCVLQSVQDNKKIPMDKFSVGAYMLYGDHCVRVKEVGPENTFLLVNTLTENKVDIILPFQLTNKHCQIIDIQSPEHSEFKYRWMVFDIEN